MSTQSVDLFHPMVNMLTQKRKHGTRQWEVRSVIFDF
jgi:hypothetical protein